MKPVEGSIAYRAARSVLDDWESAAPWVRSVTEEAADSLDVELLVYRAVYEGWRPGRHPLVTSGSVQLSGLGHGDLLDYLDRREPATLLASRLVSVVLQSDLKKHSDLALAACGTTPDDPNYRAAVELACGSRLVEKSFRGLRPERQRTRASTFEQAEQAAQLADCAAYYLERVGIDEMEAINYFAGINGLTPAGLLGLNVAIAQGSIVWAGLNVFTLPGDSVRSQGPFDIDLFMEARSHDERHAAMDGFLMDLLRSGRLDGGVPAAEVHLQTAARQLSAEIREAEKAAADAQDDPGEEDFSVGVMSSLSLDDQYRVLNSSKLYEVLGVHSQASRDEIRRAFRLRSKELHPDLNDGRTDHEELGRVTVAWEILGRADLRAAYDWKEGR